MKERHLNILIHTALSQRIKLESELTSVHTLTTEEESTVLLKFAELYFVEKELNIILKRVKNTVSLIINYLNSSPDEETIELENEIRESITNIHYGLPSSISNRVKEFGITFIEIMESNRQIESQVLDSRSSPIVGTYKIHEDISVQADKEDMRNIHKLIKLNDEIINSEIKNYENHYNEIVVLLNDKKYSQIINYLK